MEYFKELIDFYRRDPYHTPKVTVNPATEFLLEIVMITGNLWFIEYLFLE